MSGDQNPRLAEGLLERMDQVDTLMGDKEHTSELTRAELDAIRAIERMMENGVEGMFAAEGTELPPALADSMEAAGWLSSQWMEPHPEHPGDSPEGGAAYWPTSNGRFARGMCVFAERYGVTVVFADEAQP